ncbi:TPR-like protein [Auriscalpium vulgare]|uniref:TPR-like protein n=1 Tax=Auriscalpium vulgare TaxID=40419 RepID=A0ACB8S5B2_9AGAM|nr:TPR-like protein [Auriscalpium vulgare]
MASNAAAIAKEKGNAAFKAADFPAAVGHYTSAILEDASDPTFPLNRAAAYLKLGKNLDAERDCTRVLQLSSTNVKALFRRAQARSALLKYEDARADLQNALKLEPSNAPVKSELEKINGLLSKSKTKTQAKAKPIDLAPRAPASKAQTTNPTPVKRRRIPITVVETPPAPAPSSSSTSALASNTTDLLQPVSSRPLTKTNAPSSVQQDTELPKTRPASIQKVRETTQPSSRPGGGIFRASGEHTIFKRDAPPRASPQPQQSPVPPERSQDRLADEHAPATGLGAEAGDDVPKAETLPIGGLTLSDVAPLPAPALPSEGMRLPMSLFTFSRSWESLGTPLERWTLLSQFAPSSLPALFQTSLEPGLLAAMLDTFRAVLPHRGEEPKGWVKQYMEALTKVKRFNAVVLFLSRDEKEVAAKIWKDVGGVGSWP